MVSLVLQEPAWERFGKGAGPIRNIWMIKYCNPTYGLVFPGGRGTKNMRDKLADSGIEVQVIE